MRIVSVKPVGATLAFASSPRGPDDVDVVLWDDAANSRWIEMLDSSTGRVEFLPACRHHLTLHASESGPVKFSRTAPRSSHGWFSLHPTAKGTRIIAGSMALQASGTSHGCTLVLKPLDEDEPLQLFQILKLGDVEPRDIKRRRPITDVGVFTDEETRGCLSPASWTTLNVLLRDEAEGFLRDGKLTDGQSPNRGLRLAHRGTHELQGSTITGLTSPPPTAIFVNLSYLFASLGSIGVGPTESLGLRLLHRAAESKSSIQIPWCVLDSLQQRISEKQRAFDERMHERLEEARKLLHEQRGPQPAVTSVLDRADAMRDELLLLRISKSAKAAEELQLRREATMRERLTDLKARHQQLRTARQIEREAQLKLLVAAEEDSIDTLTAVEKVREKWESERRASENAASS